MRNALGVPTSMFSCEALSGVCAMIDGCVCNVRAMRLKPQTLLDQLVLANNRSRIRFTSSILLEKWVAWTFGGGLTEILPLIFQKNERENTQRFTCGTGLAA
jgi:hypothetical protein